MGLRFRKTIKLFPGVKLNLSKSGISTSIVGRGATINVGKHGTKATIGIPGTGISYTENLSKHANSVAPSEQQQPSPPDLLLRVNKSLALQSHLMGAVKFESTLRLNTDDSYWQWKPTTR
jgi:hypothetical protein